MFCEAISGFAKLKSLEGEFWIHPLNESRSRKGAFNNLIKELHGDDEKFFNYFRMSRSSINA